jgi:ubiquinone biosynthesis protein COQ9
MNKLSSIFANIKQLFSPTARSLDEKVQDAVKARTRCVAEGEFHRMMAGFYAERCHGMNPRASAAVAWDFADAMQKRETHQADEAFEQKRLAEAEAVLDARRSALAKLTAPERDSAVSE